MASDGAGEEQPDRRERILEAAIAEFAEHGFSGARVDRIAGRASANKQLIYYYFDDKYGLFNAAVRAITTRFQRVRSTLPDLPADRLVAYFEGARGDQDLIRMLLWEALEGGPDESIEEDLRTSYLRDGVESLRADQAAGLVPDSLDAAHLFLSFQALASHPFAFPQMTRFITGHDPNSEAFVEGHRRFLAQLSGIIFGATSSPPPAQQPHSITHSTASGTAEHDSPSR